MTDFPTLLYTSTSKIPTLSYTWGLKKVLLLGGTSPYRPLCILYTSTSKIPTLSYTWGLKKVLLLGGTSPYRPLCIGSTPPPNPQPGTEIDCNCGFWKLFNSLTVFQSSVLLFVMYDMVWSTARETYLFDFKLWFSHLSNFSSSKAKKVA